ncbi:hypothetical protein QOZ80_7AG0579660 [Eleusine coracana subsp. coracana]|nr:hypothetical protein QOZ80_7AG0579660 [Eleusine coracana subsp. coracana]
MPHPVTIEVDLKVKGTTESEDKDLSSLAVPFMCNDSFYSCLLNCAYTSKSSTLEFALGSIISSVEATLSLNIVDGSLPDGFHDCFAVITTGICNKSTTSDKNAERIDNEEIVLLDSRGGQVLVTDDGKVKLSRRVVSVEFRGKLKVSVKAWRSDNNNIVKKEVFTPLESGFSHWTRRIGSCKMKLSVAWSLISDEPVYTNSVL